ncbi:MAG: hypothetical protein R2867_25345 [Caldilineaceae bacterium]
MAIDPQSTLLTALAQQEIPVAVAQQCRTGRSGGVAGIAAGRAHPAQLFSPVMSAWSSPMRDLLELACERLGVAPTETHYSSGMAAAMS